MNDKELIGKVHSAVYHQCQRRGYAAPVDVLMEIGVLPKQKYEDWRFGRVDYLERVCMVNLRKLSFIMRQMRVYAQKTGLKPSFCYYKQWSVIMPLHTGKGRTESQAVSDIIDYVSNPQKTDNGRLVTGFACDSRVADAEFLLAKREYISTTGRVRGADDVLAYHVRQSFVPGEITPEEANRLGVEFAKRFTKGNHAFVVCTHIDKSHIHNHIIWNAVNLNCDRKFRNFWGSTRAVRRLNDTICVENGYSIVEDPKPHGKSYNKWLGDQAKPSHREQLRVMIDQALEQKPADFDGLLKLLAEMGCEVSRRGQAIRLKAPGWKNVARMDEKLGQGYSEDEIRAVLAGEKQHTPRRKDAVSTPTPKVNLLVDIRPHAVDKPLLACDTFRLIWLAVLYRHDVNRPATYIHYHHTLRQRFQLLRNRRIALWEHGHPCYPCRIPLFLKTESDLFLL